MSKRRWKEILWTVTPPTPGVAGWMDWSTGVQFANVELRDPAKWRRELQGSNPASHEVWQTVTHETHHSVQIATNGFMYRWACDHLRIVSSALTPLDADIRAYLTDPDPAALLKIRASIGADHRDALGRHCALLDRRGPNAVTVRHLLEANALLTEMKIHFEGLDARNVGPLLDRQAAGPEYRLAYDLVRFRLGERAAFRNFLLISNLALCSDDPPRLFDDLVDELARQVRPGPSRDGSPDTDWVLVAAETVSPGIKQSVESLESDGEKRHPVYTRIRARIDEAIKRDSRLVDFFGDPRAIFESIADDLVRPTVFRPTSSDQFPVVVPRNMEGSEVEDLLLLAVLTSGVTPTEESSEGCGSADSWDWLGRVSPQLIGLEVGVPQLRDRDIAGLAQLNPESLPFEDQARLCVFWGRCALSFDVDDPGYVWLREDVRQFIASLAATHPAFPVYLDPAPDLGMFLVWYGSLADPRAFDGASLDIQHPSVAFHVSRAATAVARQAKRLGVAARPALQGMLAPYPREQSLALISEVL